MWLIFFLPLIQKMAFLFTLSTIKNNVSSRLQCSPLEGEQFIPCHPVYIESDGDKCSAVPLLNYEQGPPFEKFKPFTCPRAHYINCILFSMGNHYIDHKFSHLMDSIRRFKKEGENVRERGSTTCSGCGKSDSCQIADLSKKFI